MKIPVPSKSTVSSAVETAPPMVSTPPRKCSAARQLDYHVVGFAQSAQAVEHTTTPPSPYSCQQPRHTATTVLPAPLKRQPSQSGDKVSPLVKRSRCVAKSTAVEVGLKTPKSSARLHQFRLLATSPLATPLKRKAREQETAELLALKLPRVFTDPTVNSEDASSEELRSAKLDRCIAKGAAGRREYARRVLAALDEEKWRRRKFHEVKNRFYVERLVEIRNEVSEQMIAEHIAAMEKNHNDRQSSA